MKAHPVLFEVEGEGEGAKKFEEHFPEMTSNASYFTIYTEHCSVGPTNFIETMARLNMRGAVEDF